MTASIGLSRCRRGVEGQWTLEQYAGEPTLIGKSPAEHEQGMSDEHVWYGFATDAASYQLRFPDATAIYRTDADTVRRQFAQLTTIIHGIAGVCR